MSSFSFIKMNGLGNDFVIIDSRYEKCDLSAEQISKISDRHRGVGCDQLIIVMLSSSKEADIRMKIFNSDGSISGACGNATRCVARLFLEEMECDSVVIETAGGVLSAMRDQLRDDCYIVNMGRPKVEWQQIPLANEQDTLHVDMELSLLKDPVAVNMGNPHIVFFVKDVDIVELNELGPQLEHHDLLPEKANIGIAQVVDKKNIKLRVWERGVGETYACGSGACAAVVAAVRRGLVNEEVSVSLPGGVLYITWRDQEDVFMSGTADTNFIGVLDSGLLN